MSETIRLPGAGMEELLTALRSDDAAVRNSAREQLAAAASPASGSAGAALDALVDALRGSADPDVRILAATALGESGNPSATGALCGALTDAEPNVRAAAADALALLGDPAAIDPLARAAGSPDDWTALSAVSALGQTRDRAALPALSAAAGNAMLSAAAAEAIGRIGAPEGLEAMRPASAHPLARDALHRAAAAILGTCDSCDAPAWLRETLVGREAELGARLRERCDQDAARLLGVAGTDSAVEELIAAAGSGPEVARAVTLALGFLPARAAGRVLFAVLPNAHGEVRSELLAALPPLDDPALLREVVWRLGDEPPDVRAAAAEALAASDSPEITVLLRSLLDERDAAAAAGAVEALSRRGELPASELLGFLRSDVPELRNAAAHGLARLPAGAELDAAVLAEALQQTRNGPEREALLLALGRHAGEAGVVILRERLGEDDPAVRFGAVAALGESRRGEQAFPVLLSLLEDPSEEIRAAALRALGRLGDPRAGAHLARALDAREKELRRAAASALEALPGTVILDRLHTALVDPDWKIRLAAVRTLARVGGERARSWIGEAASRERDPLVRQAAAEAVAEG